MGTRTLVHMEQTTLPRTSQVVTTEYRAVIECSEEWCTYCRAPRRREPQLVKPTLAEAIDHGWGMNHKVYGSSVHKVLVQSREVHDWVEVEH